MSRFRIGQLVRVITGSYKGKVVKVVAVNADKIKTSFFTWWVEDKHFEPIDEIIYDNE